MPQKRTCQYGWQDPNGEVRSAVLTEMRQSVERRQESQVDPRHRRGARGRLPWRVASRYSQKRLRRQLIALARLAPAPPLHDLIEGLEIRPCLPAREVSRSLQSGDFFDVKKFPKASFGSTSIVPDTAKGANAYTVTGDLELRGARKSVTFPATIVVSTSDVTVNSEFSINRKDFGIVYAGKADDLIRDDVVIKLDLKAPRKQ